MKGFRKALQVRQGLAASVAWIYVQILTVFFVLAGSAVRRAETERQIPEMVREIVGPMGTPRERVELANTGTLAPFSLGLAVGMVGILLYPLYENHMVLDIFIGFSIVCASFSITQFMHYLAAVVNRAMWTRAGRPAEWRSWAITGPHWLDPIAWIALSVLLCRFAIGT